MSYIVTARKWRPKVFSDVIGQQHVTETLKNAIKNNQVGHAYLFSGPRGVGKTTVARIFAKALNCENGPKEEPCNECSICSGIQQGTSMDIQELDGASHNSVNDIRDLIANVGYHSSECLYKMYIIDEVHMLSDSAFNALLKTLEEPPSNVIFIFATTEPQKIPATVISRCQRYDFHRLSVHDIAGKLKNISESDGIKIDEESVLLIARRATGAMRDAESILEQLKASRGSMITVSDVNEVLGIADSEIFFSIIEKCHENNARGAIEIFNTYFDEGGDLKEFLEGLLGHLRNLLYAFFDNGLEHVFLTTEMKTKLKEQSGWFNQNDIIRMIQYVTDVETSLAYAVIPVLRVEVALTRIATMETTIQLKDLFEKLGGETIRKESENDAMVANIADKPKPEQKTEDTNTEQKTDCLNIAPDFESVSKSWNEIITRVSAVIPAIGPSLSKASPHSLEKGTLTISFNSESTFHLKTVESDLDKIEDLFGAIVGTPIKLKCIEKKTKAKKKRVSEQDDLIAREPIIKDIIEGFGGDFQELRGE